MEVAVDKDSVLGELLEVEDPMLKEESDEIDDENSSLELLLEDWSSTLWLKIPPIHFISYATSNN